MYSRWRGRIFRAVLRARYKNVEDQGFGQGPNAVLDLVNKVKLLKGSDVYFDNLFTSLPLLSQLSDLGIGGTGTLRQNCLFRVPITTKKNVEKTSVDRGYNEAMYHEDQVLTVWKDNKPVFMASNKWDVEPFTTCRRFSRVQKTRVNVPRGFQRLFLVVVFPVAATA